jgi:hypothetical protein
VVEVGVDWPVVWLEWKGGRFLHVLEGEGFYFQLKKGEGVFLVDFQVARGQLFSKDWEGLGGCCVLPVNLKVRGHFSLLLLQHLPLCQQGLGLKLVLELGLGLG